MINDTYLTRKRLMKATFSLANRITLLPNYAVKATKRSLNVNSDTIVANG
ncbi:hypothetical protein [Colwellia sp. PAMC 20917]|nr:hypothetical protein [Colwellia sp. PAMC 20917]